MTPPPIQFDGVTHYFGETKALDTVTFDVERGTIYALLGRNGAGKTTALQILLGFLSADRGRSTLLGYDSARFPALLRDRVGYVAEGQKLVPHMRVRDLVAYQRGCFPSFDPDRCARHLKTLGIPTNRRIKTLSRGMRAQLALALTLAPRPEVLVLDDPALGLDAIVRREFLEVMIDLIQEEGSTVLFTSHVLTDVERVADRIGIIVEGVLRVNAPLDVLKARVRRYRLLFDGDAPPPPEIPGLVCARRRRDRLVLTVVDGEDVVPDRAAEIGARDIASDALGLEDLFIDYASGGRGGRP